MGRLVGVIRVTFGDIESMNTLILVAVSGTAMLGVVVSDRFVSSITEEPSTIAEIVPLGTELVESVDENIKLASVGLAGLIVDVSEVAKDEDNVELVTWAVVCELVD